MGIGFEVKDSFYDKIEHGNKAKADARKLARDATFNIGSNASFDAPIDTGALKLSLIEGIAESNTEEGFFEIIEELTYVRVQELVDYPSQAPHETGFVRRAVEREEPQFVKKVTDRYKKR